MVPYHLALHVQSTIHLSESPQKVASANLLNHRLEQHPSDKERPGVLPPDRSLHIHSILQDLDRFESPFLEQFLTFSQGHLG